MIGSLTIKYCPFCGTDVVAYDDIGDLFTCRNKFVPGQGSHYQLYFYGTKDANDNEEFQEQIVFETFSLAIEHPSNEWTIKLINDEEWNKTTYAVREFIIDIEPFNLEYDYEAIRNKLETYITFR